MAYSLKEIREHPNYKAATPEQKQQMEYATTVDAWDTFKRNLDYVGGDEETRSAYESEFNKRYPDGARLQTEEENVYNSFAENIGTQLSQGAESTADALALGVAQRSDLPDKAVAGIAEYAHQRASDNYTPTALKGTYVNMAAETKRWEQANTLSEKLIAAGKTTFATIKEAVTNPEGVAYLSAQSAPNVIAPIAGTIIGAGTAGAPGALVGGFAGSYSTEEGAYLQDALAKELQAQGKDVTRENIEAIMRDEELYSKLLGKAQRKAVGTAGTDAILNLLGGKLATTAIKKAKDAGKTVSLASRAGSKVKATGAEIISEPISEAAGQLLAEGKVDAGELMGETLGGIGTSAATGAANVSAYGEAIDVAKKGVSKAQSLKKQPIHKAQSQYGYEKDVEERVESGNIEDIKETNPIKTVEVVQKINAKKDTPIAEKLTNLEVANEVYQDFDKKKQAIVEEALALDAIEDRALTKEESKRFKALATEARSIDATMKIISPLIKSMSSAGITDVDQQAIATKIEDAVKENDSKSIQDSILTIFGSKRGYTLLENESLDTLIDKPEISGDTKEQIKKIQAYQKVEKSMDEVGTDIFEGGEGFLGIKNYTQAVATALSEKTPNIEKANESLEGLKSFSERHKLKADTFTSVYQSNLSGEPVSDSVQAQMDIYNTEYNNRNAVSTGYNLTTTNAEGLVGNIQLEAEALAKAVDMAESWITPHSPTPSEGATGSGTTETDTTTKVSEAKAKDAKEVVDVEGSTRTVDTEVEETSTTKPKEKDTPSLGQVLTNLIDGIRNKITETFKAKKAKGILQNVPDVKDILDPEILKDSNIFTDKQPYTEEAGAVITSISQYGKQFTKAFSKNFLAPKADKIVGKSLINMVVKGPKLEDKRQFIAAMYKVFPNQTKEYTVSEILNGLNEIDGVSKASLDTLRDRLNKRSVNSDTYGYRNPLLYLTDNQGVLPENVVNAIMATTWQWLATRASETSFNKPSEISQMLGQKKDFKPSRQAIKLLSQIGTHGTYLQESLGSEILSLLGIEPTATSDYDTKNRLEVALGLQAIATLQSMGLLEQTDVYVGDQSTGFQGLMGSQIPKDGVVYSFDDNFYVPKTPEGYPDYSHYKDKGTVSFYKVPNKNKLSQFEEIQGASKDTWDLLFKGEKSKANYSFEPINRPAGKNRKMVRTNEEVSTRQEEAMRKQEKAPHEISSRTMSFYLMLGMDNIKELLGYVNEDFTHAVNVDGAIGKNRAIEASDLKVRNFLKNIKNQPKKYKAKFYTPWQASRMGRMTQVGDINLQGDKSHRFLFNQTKWNTEIDLMNDGNGVDQFLAAVALGMDQETIKKGGMQKAIQAGLDTLAHPDVVEAVEAIREIFSTQGRLDNLDPEAMEKLSTLHKDKMDIITKGAMHGELGMHSLKALIEYARFLDAMEDTKRREAEGKPVKKFKTDLTMEIDGVGNGIAIGRIQLIKNFADHPAILASLKNSGFHFESTKEDLAEHFERELTHDAYQVTGFAWGDRLQEIKNNLSDLTQETRNVFYALNNMFGDFRDKETGNVNKIVRGLSKDPTMRTVYGMGKKALLKELSESFVADVYERIEKAVAKNDRADIELLAKDISVIIGEDIFNTDRRTLESLLEVEFSEDNLIAIHYRISLFHGEALSEAIEEVYGDMKKVYSDLNTGIQTNAAMYNAMYRLKVQAIEKDRKPTVKDIEDIETELKGMFPHVVTRYGNRIPIGKESAKKTDVKADKIVQTYKDMPGKKGSPLTLDGINNPSVGGTILSIHNQDSVVATELMYEHNVLNVHDGFITGINEVEALTNSANEAFYDTVNTFDMGKAIAGGVNRSVNIFKKYNDQLKKVQGITQKEINTVVAEELTKFNLGVTYPKGKRTTLKHNTYGTFIRNTIEKMNDTATEIADNKAKVLKSVVAVNQYYHPDSQYVTGNKPKYISLGKEKYDPYTITQEREKVLQAEINKFKEVPTAIGEEFVKESLKGSSTNSEQMSTDPREYRMRQEVSAANVVDMYDNIKNDSTIKDSAEHDSKLKGILQSIVQNVMNPIDMYLRDNPGIETEGIHVHTGSRRDKIFISSQNTIIGPVSGALMQGIRMSTGEVYTHELLHSVLHVGLQKKLGLRRKVDQLFDIAKAKLGDDGYKAFLSDPNTTNQFEIDAAKERYDYIFRNVSTQKVSEFEGGINPATGIASVQERSTYLDEFITFALTNEHFGKALADIQLSDTKYNAKSWKDFKGNNIQETLSNIARIIMDFIFKKFTSTKANQTMDAELHNLALLLAKKDSDNKSMFYSGLIKVGQATSKVSPYMNQYIKKSVSKLPVARTVAQLRRPLDYVIESDTLLGQELRERRNAYRRLDNSITKSTISELVGRTDRMDPIHTLLSKRNIFLDSAKQQATETYIKMANDLFNSQLSDSNKTAITKAGIKTDAVVLFRSLGLDGLLSVLKHRNESRKAKVALLKKMDDIPHLAPHTEYYKRAADALGYFMVHGRSRAGEVAFQNSITISSLANTENAGTLTNEQIAEADVMVDQLASLYALEYVNASHKNSLINLIETDPEGVTGTFQMHDVLKEDSLKNAFGDNKYKFTKGYTKQILNSRINIKYGTLADETAFANEGYVRNQKPLPRDTDETSLSVDNQTEFYIYVSRSERVNTLQPGIVSYTNNAAKGTPTSRLAANMNLTTAEGRANNKAIIEKKKAILADMANPNITPTLHEGNFMVPAVDDNGKITQCRYMMAEETKDSYMEQITTFDTIFGAMAGQIVDKTRSPEINKEVVLAMKAEYDANYQENPGEYLHISPRSDDPKLAEIYSLLPGGTKKFIKETWGTNEMFVPKDFATIVFGYREYSLTEAFAKTPADRNRLEKMFVGAANFILRDKAALHISNVESIAIEATKIAKSNIIIKSLHVTLGNLGSNLIYLKSRGIPVHYIAKKGWEAVAQGNKYQIDIKKLDKLKLKRKILLKGTYTQNQVTELDAQIARVKEAIRVNPTTKSIQSGLMPSLIDDVETVTSGSAFPTELEKKVGKITSKLPEPVRNVGKVFLLTEDTQAYKTLNNIVKMTDFVGRHVLYNHLTSVEGMSHKEAIANAEDSFVNFNIPSHRIVEYLNSIGILWFTKYGTRILPVIKDSIVDKPFDVFMAYMVSVHSGMDNILNSVPGVTKDILAPVGNIFEALPNSVGEIVTFNTVKEVLN